MCECPILHSDEALSTNKCANSRLLPSPPWRRQNPGNSTPHIPSLPDTVYLMHSEFPIKRGKNDLGSISGNIVSARERQQSARIRLTARLLLRRKKFGLQIHTLILPKKNYFEKNFLLPEFIFLILSLNHTQISFEIFLWLGDTYLPDKYLGMHTTLTCAPAHAIQVPGQSVTRQTELLSVGLKLQPVVRDVVLELEEARDEPKNWAGSSHFSPFSSQPITSLSLIISFYFFPS